MSTATQEQFASSSASSKDIGRLHLGYLDGLRGLAALYVVLHHLYIFQFGTAARRGLSGFLVNWLLYGHLAVDVFIVLSGFCLVIPAARTGQITGGPFLFFRKRARRILPPFYASLISCAAALLVVHHVKQASHSLFTLNGLVVNALLLQDLFPKLNYQFNLTFWSVAVEWKIYFLFPLLLLAWRRFGFAGLLSSAAALALAAAAALHEWRPAMPLGHTCPWYVFLFGMGMAAGLAAFSEKRRRYTPMSLWGVSGFLLLLLLRLYPITSLGEDAFYVPHLPLIDTAAGALTASSLLLLAQAGGPGSAGFRSGLAWKPLAALGTFAYSLYLVHFPLISCLDLAAHKLPGLHNLPMREAFFFLAGTPLIVAASYLFHLAFERPFMTRPGVKIKTEAQAEAAAVFSPAP